MVIKQQNTKRKSSLTNFGRMMSIFVNVKKIISLVGHHYCLRRSAFCAMMSNGYNTFTWHFSEIKISSVQPFLFEPECNINEEDNIEDNTHNVHENVDIWEVRMQEWGKINGVYATAHLCQPRGIVFVVKSSAFCQQLFKVFFLLFFFIMGSTRILYVWII